MNYLSIGTNTLAKELFLNIKNTDGIKPTGGLWATKQGENLPSYNEWVDYLCTNPHLLFYRQYENPFYLQGVYLTLKPTTNLFIIDSTQKIDFLKKHYPLNNWIDYEKISKDYDGIFINISSFKNINDNFYKEIINQFSVSTLILFNLDCIKHYQKASIDLSHIDLYNTHKFPEYHITIDEEKHQINEPSLEIQSLIEIIKHYMIENNIKPSPENYETIKKIFQGAINETLKYHEISQKETLLIRKVFNQF